MEKLINEVHKFIKTFTIGYVLGLVITGIFILSHNFTGCDTQAQYEPKQAHLLFEYPADYDQGVAYFVIYAGNSPAMTMTLDSIGVMPYTFPDSTFDYFPFPVNDAYFQAGAVAVDTAGLRSDMALSPVYGYWELYGPEKPISLEIRR